MNDLKGIIEDCNKSDLVSDKVIKKIIEIIGQEEWQILHDENSDICTTMGELIITLNGIAEPEQENKVLAQNLEDTEIVNKALEKENAELKADNDARKFAMAMSEKVEKQLREENAKWKDEWQEQVQKASDEGYARTLQTIQLTKAKEIIREFVKWATWQGNSKCPSFKDIQDKAEQFLNSEVEKCGQ